MVFIVFSKMFAFKSPHLSHEIFTIRKHSGTTIHGYENGNDDGGDDDGRNDDHDNSRFIIFL